ncbi:hypothetical protein L7F22_057333 [Adiantum nelumboides]|nr:hypothetical protein [Adiantum nelumboides]
MKAFSPSKLSSSLMDSFSPVGLHVLVVDDDPLCLLVLERMLKQCSYKDVDGFKLLEIVGLELDLPVIMMSANADTSVVMKGITHGACDYLIKPVRIEELRNIWQHVVRRKGTESPNFGLRGGDMESSNESSDTISKKRKDVSVVGEIMHIEDASSLKRARVNWTVDLHQRFVKAVNQLGVEKAVPKKVLDVMNVKGLTRENVASHLQKYRLYLKRLSGVTPEPCPIASFQASKGGESGGSMRIMPGGKSSNSATAMKGLSHSGANISVQSSDTKETGLPQFNVSEKQRQISANRAQVLGALGFVDSHPDRNASFDMSAYVPKSLLLSSPSMPSRIALNAMHPCQEGDGMESKPLVEGFVSQWNIKPLPIHRTGECAVATSMPVRENHNNLSSENRRDDCHDLETQESGDMDVPLADMFCYTPMEGTKDSSLDALDLAQNQEQLNVSDYLMDDMDMDL